MGDYKKIVAAITDGEVFSSLSHFGSYGSLPAFLMDDRTGFPAILQASFQIKQDTEEWKLVRSFEQISIEIRQRVFEDKWDDVIKKGSVPSIDGGRLRFHIKKKLADHKACLVTGKATIQPLIHLEGVYIANNLDLSGMDIPCSVRFMNCYIEGGLILDGTQLSGLDLSGSIIGRGLSAPHLKASGAVRLRRTVITGIFDLGAAEIAGPFDAADSICIPAHLPPSGVVWASDRSLVNFGLSKIGKEMRLNRVRWFGGMNMRGMHVSGSLFLSDAIIRSPVALVEKLIVESVAEGDGNFSPLQKSAAMAEEELAYLLHKNSDSSRDVIDAEMLRSVKLDGHPLQGIPLDTGVFDASLLGRLLFESRLVQSTAIRGDGAVIDGVFSAEGMRIGGRVRLKKIEVKLALVLSGGRFRTFRSFRETLSEIDVLCPEPKYRDTRHFAAYVLQGMNEADNSNPSSRHQYVIDLRRAVIGSSVEFRKDTRKFDQYDKTGKPIVSEEDRHLSKQIATALWSLRVDPSTFLQVFFDRPGDVNEFINSPNSATNHYSLDHIKFSTARARLEEIGDLVNPSVYETIRFENNPSNDDKDKLRPEPASGRVKNSLQDIENAFSGKQTGGTAAAEVIDICSNLGRLKSTLIIGEISLSGAQIGGSLSFLGFAANVFGELKRSERPTIMLDNARIHDDFDIRDSVGIQAITAEQAQIGGSIRMANDPMFMLQHDRFGPAARRALYVSVPKAIPRSEKKSYPKFAFEGARIGGDATFVFDHEFGPTLDLAFAKFAGKLTILPARGGVELTRREIEDEAFEAAQTASAGEYRVLKILRWCAGKIVGVLDDAAFGPDKFKTFSERTAKILFHKSDSKAKLRTYRPFIDLRSVRATVFTHPPSSWPQQDNLLIEGFRYDSTKGFGPLLSARRTWSEVEKQKWPNRIGVALNGVVAAIGTLLLFWGIDCAAGALFVQDPNDVTPLFPLMQYEVFGKSNVYFFLLLCWLWLWISLMKAFTLPKMSDSVPLAVKYLPRQRRKFNTRRTSSALHPYDSYIHAAKVLRADGHLVSADQVELERLRMRRKALSWRTAGPLRFLLKLTDVTMNYGFEPIRIVAFAILLLMTGTMLTEAAKSEGIAIPVMNGLPHEGALRLSTVGKGRKPDTSRVREGDNNHGIDVNIDSETKTPDMADSGASGSKKVGSEYKPRELIPIIYVLDVMVPFLDLGQEQRFDFFERVAEKSETNVEPEPSARLDSAIELDFAAKLAPAVIVMSFGLEVRLPSAVKTDGDAGKKPTVEEKNKKSLKEYVPGKLLHVPFILKIFGWIFTSLIALSVAARLETIMARNENS